MKKRISALIICCVIGSALLAGCGEEASVQLDKENAIKYTMEELYADIGHDEDKAKIFVGDNTYEITGIVGENDITQVTLFARFNDNTNNYNKLRRSIKEANVDVEWDFVVIVFLPSEITKNISKGDTITVYGIVTGSSIGSMSRVQLLLDNAELKE